jgi:hypothetical protein
LSLSNDLLGLKSITFDFIFKEKGPLKMEKISALSQRRKSGIYYGLLCEGAELSWEILRLKAETARIYQAGSRVGASVMAIHERTETYIAGSSNEFQRLSTLDEEVSIVGELITKRNDQAAGPFERTDRITAKNG